MASTCFLNVVFVYPLSTGNSFWAWSGGCGIWGPRVLHLCNTLRGCSQNIDYKLIDPLTTCMAWKTIFLKEKFHWPISIALSLLREQLPKGRSNIKKKKKKSLLSDQYLNKFQLTNIFFFSHSNSSKDKLCNTHMIWNSLFYLVFVSF